MSDETQCKKITFFTFVPYLFQREKKIQTPGDPASSAVRSFIPSMSKSLSQSLVDLISSGGTVLSTEMSRRSWLSTKRNTELQSVVSQFGVVSLEMLLTRSPNLLLYTGFSPDAFHFYIAS